MPKISKKILTEQLRELEADQLILREVIETHAPQIVIYHLTEKGLAFRQLLDEMIKWGMIYFKEEYEEKTIQEFLQKKSVLKL